MNRVGRVVYLQLRNYHNRTGGSGNNNNFSRNRRRGNVVDNEKKRLRPTNPGLTHRMAMLQEAGENPYEMSMEELEGLDETDADFSDAVDMHRIYEM